MKTQHRFLLTLSGINQEDADAVLGNLREHVAEEMRCDVFPQSLVCGITKAPTTMLDAAAIKSLVLPHIGVEDATNMFDWLMMNREAMRDANDNCIADSFIDYITYTQIAKLRLAQILGVVT